MISHVIFHMRISTKISYEKSHEISYENQKKSIKKYISLNHNFMTVSGIISHFRAIQINKRIFLIVSKIKNEIFDTVINYDLSLLNVFFQRLHKFVDFFDY